HDNEITVLKSAGTHLYHLLKPAVLLGLLTSGVTLWLYVDLIPRTQQMLQSQFVADAEEVLYTILAREHALRQPKLPYVIYVREVQGRRLVDVIFKERAKIGTEYYGYKYVARAREARLRVDMANGQIIIDMDRCLVAGDKNDSILLTHKSIP